MSCKLCPIVDRVCFWGALGPVKRWKRPVLLACSVAILGLGIFYCVLLLTRPHNAANIALGILTLAIGMFGLIVSWLGCDECVAKAFGRI